MNETLRYSYPVTERLILDRAGYPYFGQFAAPLCFYPKMTQVTDSGSVSAEIADTSIVARQRIGHFQIRIPRPNVQFSTARGIKGKTSQPE